MPVYKDKEHNTWYASFHYRDWTGKDVRKLKRGFSTKKEAQEWESHFKLQKANSIDMTFGDFYKVYEQDVKPKVRYNTWCSKQHIIETKLLPYFKNLVMRDIAPRDIIQWQNAMRESCTKSGEQFSGTYLKTMQAQLSCIFNHAVRFYDLPSNPVRKAGSFGQQQPDEMLFWTKEEYLQFIPTLADKEYSYLAFELLYWCGIRMGELRALTRADFDFNKNTVSITKSYQRLKRKEITEPIRESIAQRGNRPRLFSRVVTVAVEALEFLIASVLFKKPREVPKQTEQTETEHPELGDENSTAAVKTTKEEKAEPEQPKMTRIASKYPKLFKVNKELEDQNGAIQQKQKQLSAKKKELSEAKGWFKGRKKQEKSQ